jgi:type IV pilus assembly protein PilM
MSRSRILKYFPTPTYLDMPFVGIEVADRSVRFFEFEKSGGKFAIKQHGERSLPAGTITSGDIVNSGAIVSVLSAIQKEIGTHFVSASLPEEKAYLFKTEIPKVDRKEIRGAIELLLEENVPIKPNEALFDYEIIKSDARDHLDVSVSVLPEKTVFDFVEVFEKSGFQPLVFEVDAQASAHAVIPANDSQTYFVANIGAMRTGLSIVSDGVVYYSSTMGLGGNALTSAIEKQMKVTTAEAEVRKREKGLIGAKQNMELFFSLMSTMSVLRDEVNRLYGYWQNLKRTKHGLGDIKTVILCGSDAAIPGFVEYFSDALASKVTLADVWVNAGLDTSFVPSIPFAESLDYATAIGLAMPKTD